MNDARAKLSLTLYSLKPGASIEALSLFSRIKKSLRIRNFNYLTLLRQGRQPSSNEPRIFVSTPKAPSIKVSTNENNF